MGDVNVVNELGTPPLFEAFVSGNELCVQKLLAAKASVNQRMHTARWPNWKESRCIVAFAGMHGEKDLTSIKMAREMLNLEWSHHVRESQRELPLFSSWNLVSQEWQKAGSFSTLQWCLENGYPLHQGEMGSSSNDMQDTAFRKILVFIQCENQATHSHLLFKIFDLKVTPPVGDRYDLFELSSFEQCHIRSVSGIFPLALADYFQIWNDYQILLAARDFD